jgi:hypothetical protein
MKSHTDLLNALAKKHNLNNYLEIGVQHKENNFDKIICKNKFGIDPDPGAQADYVCSSDQFFHFNFNPVRMFDLVFIDGLHHADQVKKDFDNSLRFLLPHGFIVIHDCCPQKETSTFVPRNAKVWHGDVYKFVMKLQEYSGIDFRTYDFDEGCCMVWRDETKQGTKSLVVPCWESYLKYKNELMRIPLSLTFIAENRIKGVTVEKAFKRGGS